MKYFPYENYKLTTKLSADEMVRRLSEVVEPNARANTHYKGWALPNGFGAVMFAFDYGLSWGSFKLESSKSKKFLENLFEASEAA